MVERRRHRRAQPDTIKKEGETVCLTRCAPFWRGPLHCRGFQWLLGMWARSPARRGCGRRASRCWNAARLCLPLTQAENAARLLALQSWAAAESAAHRAPVFGNTDTEREVLRAEQGRIERTDAGGTVVYTVRLQADYTQSFTEELQ